MHRRGRRGGGGAAEVLGTYFLSKLARKVTTAASHGIHDGKLVVVLAVLPLSGEAVDDKLCDGSCFLHWVGRERGLVLLARLRCGR